MARAPYSCTATPDSNQEIQPSVPQQANAGSIHAPEKFKVQNIGDLDSGESLRRASVSP